MRTHHWSPRRVIASGALISAIGLGFWGVILGTVQTSVEANGGTCVNSSIFVSCSGLVALFCLGLGALAFGIFYILHGTFWHYHIPESESMKLPTHGRGTLHERSGGEFEPDLIDATRNLCVQLRIARPPEAVHWGETWKGPSNSVRNVRTPADLPKIVGPFLVLGEELRWTLEAGDWLPLIGSSLIYTDKYRWRRYSARILMAGIPTVLFALGMGYVFAFLIHAGWLAGLSGYSYYNLNRLRGYLIIGAFIFFSALSGPYLKRLRLKADSRSANELADRSDFLRILHKIDDLKLKDVQMQKKSSWRTHYSSRPSITQRITNLERYFSP